MNLPKYQLTAEDEFLSFEFESNGPRGVILKKIQFRHVAATNIYNLGFGDQNLQTGDIDDTIVSNNGDSEKVLATIVEAVFAFLQQYPEAWIFASGSTKSRTRLYQMGINRYFNEVDERLEIYGQLHDEWYPFSRGVSFEAFLVRQKTVN